MKLVTNLVAFMDDFLESEIEGIYQDYDIDWDDVKKYFSDYPTKISSELTKECDRYEGELEDVLNAWVKEHPLAKGYKVLDLMSEGGAPLDVFMTLRGEGAGIWDGDWDHFFNDPKEIKELEKVLKDKLGKFADDTGGGSINTLIYEEAMKIIEELKGEVEESVLSKFKKMINEEELKYPLKFKIRGQEVQFDSPKKGFTSMGKSLRANTFVVYDNGKTGWDYEPPKYIKDFVEKKAKEVAKGSLSEEEKVFGLYRFYDIDDPNKSELVAKGTIEKLNRWAKGKGLEFVKEAGSLFGGYWRDKEESDKGQDVYMADILGITPSLHADKEYFNNKSSLAGIKNIIEQDEDEEEEEEVPDWADLKKQVRPWDIFDTNEDLSVEQLVKYLEKQDQDLIIDSEYIADIGFQGAESILKDNGFDPKEIGSEYPEEFDELRFEVENAGKFNIERIIPTIFVKIKRSIFEYEPSDEESFNELLKFAKGEGFTEAEVNELAGGLQSGEGFGVAIIGNDIENIWDSPTIRGEKVLYGHNAFLGSGNYVSSGKEITHTFKTGKDLAEAIDWGSYSLGDVFGSREWSWR